MKKKYFAFIAAISMGMAYLSGCSAMGEDDGKEKVLKVVEAIREHNEDAAFTITGYEASSRNRCEEEVKDEPVYKQEQLLTRCIAAEKRSVTTMQNVRLFISSNMIPKTAKVEILETKDYGKGDIKAHFVKITATNEKDVFILRGGEKCKEHVIVISYNPKNGIVDIMEDDPDVISMFN